ncbi:hypothetical protein QTP88_016347 [Uroleucon formosanum]
MSQVHVFGDCDEENINEWLLMDTNDPEYQILSDYEIVRILFEEDDTEEEENETDDFTAVENRLSHSEGFDALDLTFKWLERQEQSNTTQLLQLRRLRDIAALKYDVLMVQDNKKLIFPVNKNENILYYILAYNIIDIFTLIGAPSVLQSDNGREFANQIVSSLKDLWPKPKIVHGKPRHSQSQGSVERANQDIENMLTTWIQEQITSQWSQGIKITPCEALFGCKIKIGLNTSNLPEEVVENIKTEEDLTAIITKSETTSNIIELEDLNTKITKIKTNNENALNLRKNATKNLEIQADKMKKISDKKLLAVGLVQQFGFQYRMSIKAV